MSRYKKLPKKGTIYYPFLWATLVLLFIGLITYISTSLSIYAENKDLFWSLIFRHTGFGVGGGMIALFVLSNINYRIWKKYAPYLFGLSLIVTLMVFVPGLGFSHGGATRWISLFGFSFQPAELLKITTVMMLGAWIAQHYEKIRTWRYGLAAFWVITGLTFAVLFRQPDTGTMALIGFTTFTLYWLSGAPIKHLLATVGIAVILALGYTAINPHVIDRIRTFSDNQQDPYGSSYQVRQSRIAIGSGRLIGRGLGQSVHKFGPYLPESNSDSIFAVYAEEFGFLGSIVLIMLYISFFFFGTRIALKAPGIFARNLVMGILILIVIQSFFNIGAISGLLPLSGMPLIFVSHGGTALFITLASIGIILNVSRYMKKPRQRV